MKEVDWNKKMLGVPLIISALRNDREDIVKILLKLQGVDPNIKDSRGESLATVGVRRKNVEFLKVLSEVPGLDWNSRNKAGDFPVTLAVKQDQIQLFREAFKIEKSVC